MPPCAAHLGAEAVQPHQVCGNGVILEVSVYDPLQPCTDDRHGFVPLPVQCIANRRHRLPHPLLRREANDLELSSSVCSTTMREPQKVERLRPFLPLAPPSVGRKSPELDQPRFIGVKNQRELCEPFPQVCQKGPRRLFLLKAHYTVVRITDNDDCSPPWLFTPVLNPLIEGVMQIDIRQQGRYHGSLRSALCRGYSASVLDHARFEPFADQTENPLIGDPVFEKPKHPAVIDFIEKGPNVGVQYPVHLPALDSDRERVQRIVLSAPHPEPIRKPQKILFVDCAQHRDYGLLHNLVLYRGNTQRPLPTIGFRDKHPSRWHRPIRPGVNQPVQYRPPPVEDLLILPPRRPVHTCRGVSLQADRKSTRLNSSHLGISYAVFCLKKKKKK